MRVMVISASNRNASQSLKISNWLVEHARKLQHSSELLDLYLEQLPLYDDAEHPELTEKVQSLQERLSQADSYVFVSPEWNGMMSVALANLLHYIGNEMANKPVMLVGVSSGRGGSYPMDQMRLIGHKNRHYVISPENLIVSGVEQAFNDHEWLESSTDLKLKERADYSLKVLAQYADALTSVRASGVIDLKKFANGV